MENDGNISESLTTASYVMDRQGFCHLAETRPFTLGDVRISVRESVIYYEVPASRVQQELLEEQAESLEWPLYAFTGKCNRPVWLPIVLEGLEKLVFRHEGVDYANGQSYMRLYALEGNQVVGYVDYSIYLDEILISFIHVNEDRRRGGIATAMAKNLQAQYPDKEINWGSLTDQGSAFLHALDRNFVPEPRYAELRKARDDAKAEFDSLQAAFDAYGDFSKVALTPEQRSELLQKGERMNELDTLIYDLDQQLRDLKPGVYKVVTESEMSPEEMDSFTRRSLTLHGEWVMTGAGEAAAGPFKNWVYKLEDPYQQVLSSQIFLRDGGTEDTLRFVWLKVHIASPNPDKELEMVFGDKWVMFDYDQTFYIEPPPQEFEDLKEIIARQIVNLLRDPLAEAGVFDLNRFKELLHRRIDRVVRAFSRKRDI